MEIELLYIHGIKYIGRYSTWNECVCVCAIGLTIVLRNLGKSNLCKSGVLDLRPGEKRLLECS